MSVPGAHPTGINATEREMVERLHGFTAALAAAGAPTSPEKQIDFLRAIAITAPPSARRLYWTGRVTLISRAEDLHVFDRVFAQWFGEEVPATAPPPQTRPSNEQEQSPSRSGDLPGPEVVSVREGKGTDATAHELLRESRFTGIDGDQALLLAEIRRALAALVPQTRARRRIPATRAASVDLRRVARHASRAAGEVTELYWRERPGRPRRVLMLIDVSGSLRATSPDALRVGHAFVRELPRSEVYTFGTRLTHVTAALRDRDVDAALARLAAVVADVNGGTRIGAALDEFLTDGRRAGSARDAVAIVVSDGLERGDPGLMAHAVGRLARLAHSLVWWSPLACDARYQPVTRGMLAIRDELDDLVGVRDLTTALAAVRRLPALGSGRRRTPAPQKELASDAR